MVQYIAISQCFGIPVSFLSLAMTSVKLFYSQRIDYDEDVDPSLKMIMLVLPVIIFQIIGPSFSVIFLTAYFKAFVLLFVILLLITQYLVTYHCCYNYDHNRSFNEGENIKRKYIFITAVLTAWITPCTVWKNNFQRRTYFLLTSSLTTAITHMLCLSCIYIFTSLDAITFTDLFPITHCIVKQGYHLDDKKINFTELSYFNFIRIVSSNESSLNIQRICLENENPTDLFFHYVGPMGFFLLFVSFLASFVLQRLGHYYTLFKWSKMCCFKPIDTSMLVENYRYHQGI